MLVIITSILIYVSIYDLYYKKIPNPASLCITILGFIYTFLLNGSYGLTLSFYGLSAGFFVALFFYRFAHLGSGDVKLIAAIGSFVGYQSILLIIAYSYVISAVLGLIFIKLWLAWYKNKQKNDPEEKVKKLRSERIPMAPGISLATFYVLYTTHF